MQRTREPNAPQPAASVGVANPKRILPNAENTNAAGGTNPKINSTQTSFIDPARNFIGKTGPNFGSIQHRKVTYPAYKTASIIPGIIAAENKSVTGISMIGPITTNIILGGIRIPKVPPAVITPAESFTS